MSKLAFEPGAPAVRDATGERAGPAEREGLGCESTLTVADAANIEWDAAVIGAGPTGALAARQLSQSGLRTLLLDRSPFPRAKICGGCISGLGRQLLVGVGLGELLEPPGAAPLGTFDLAAGGRRVSFELPSGAAVSRSHFDAELVRRAIRSGATFLAGTTTVVRGLADAGRSRTIELQRDVHTARARVRMVVVADGLGRTSLKRHRAFAPRVAAASRMGLGATLSASASELEPGRVLMSVARDGYVGMVQLPGDELNLAAAVDPNLVRQHGPSESVRAILLQAGAKPPAGLETAEWRGTGLLTRQSPRTSARRLLVLGDAAGYVEPFTGEGMTWGMLSAVLAAPLLADWLSRDPARNGDGAAARREFARLSRAWSRLHRTHIAHRQRDCRILARLLRSSTGVRLAMALISHAPRVATPLIRHYWNSGKGVEATVRAVNEKTPR